MFVRFVVGLVFLGAVTDVAEQHQVTPLPAEWHGTWSGKLSILGANDKASEVPMTLKIEPLKGTEEISWIITYGEGSKASPRNYKLVPVADKPGSFMIDENNGILLDARLANGVLYSYFDVGGALLTARYELRGETLRFEITSAKAAEKKTGQGKVQGYKINAVQTAELRKK